MSDATQRSWDFYLEDMIGFAEKALAYTADRDLCPASYTIVVVKPGD
ncbi:MAG: hypothetical protein WCG26_08230 [Chloroflexales bacterium]